MVWYPAVWLFHTKQLVVPYPKAGRFILWVGISSLEILLQYRSWYGWFVAGFLTYFKPFENWLFSAPNAFLYAGIIPYFFVEANSFFSFIETHLLPWGDRVLMFSALSFILLNQIISFLSTCLEIVQDEHSGHLWVMGAWGAPNAGIFLQEQLLDFGITIIVVMFLLI